MILKYVNDDLESRYADLGNNFSFDVGFAAANVFVTFYRFDGDDKKKMIEMDVALKLEERPEDFVVLMLDLIDFSEKLLEKAQKETEVYIEEAIAGINTFLNLNKLNFFLREILSEMCVKYLDDQLKDETASPDESDD